MSITQVLAGIAVADFDAALDWYQQLLGRPADARPMDGLAEWYVVDGGTIQVVHQPEHAGHGLLTLSVDDLRAEVDRLRGRGLSPGPIDDTSSALVLFAQLRDHDGSTVTLVEAR